MIGVLRIGTGTSCRWRAREYAPGMPSAAPSAWECMRCTRSSAAWLLPCLLALAGCSVYTEDMLLDDDESTVDDDDDVSGAGKTNGVGGKSNGVGGKSG